ncbi:hypothetical protein LCGC14_1852370 [marine sediment metagenome]|uniref:Uncharacterized protein n=1 Tax=marine sediment metagenome TaxID=412755 RepID=A0A0F9J941_9ZZZZ
MAETDTKTDILDSQDAAIIAAIVVVDGLHDVPTADAAPNTYMRDVIGNKIDAAVTVTTTSKSIMAYIKGALNLLNLIQPDSSDNLSTAMTELEAILDLAAIGTSGSLIMDGSVQTICNVSDTTAFEFLGGSINWTGLNFGAGEDTTIKGYWKNISGGSLVQFYEETFLAAGLPSPLGVPFPRDTDTQCTPSRLANIHGVKFTAQQAAAGGGYNTLVVEIFDAKAGG